MPCSDPSYRQFDFWLGTVRQLWENTDAGGKWSVAFDGIYKRK